MIIRAGAGALILVLIAAVVLHYPNQKRDDGRVMIKESWAKLTKASKKGDAKTSATAGVEAMEGVKKLVQAVTPRTTEDAAALRALTKVAIRIQQWLREYGEANTRLGEANILNGGIRDRASIERDRQIVRDFLAANAALLKFAEHPEDVMRMEFEAEHVPADYRETVMAGFLRDQEKLRPLTIEIRHCSQTTGEGFLAVVDFLDQNWGKWHRNEHGGKLIFQDTSARDTYNALVEKVQSASEQGARIQAKAMSGVNVNAFLPK